MFLKKLEIEKTKTTFIISVLKVVYLLVLVFSISNFFINKNSQGRKLSEKKIPTFGNSALTLSNSDGPLLKIVSCFNLTSLNMFICNFS